MTHHTRGTVFTLILMTEIAKESWNLSNSLYLQAKGSGEYFKKDFYQSVWVFRGTWVAHSVKRPTLAKVMVSLSMSSSPPSGSVLTAQRLLQILCLPLSVPLPCSHSVSLSLSLSKINKHLKKCFKKVFGVLFCFVFLLSFGTCWGRLCVIWKFYCRDT